MQVKKQTGYLVINEKKIPYTIRRSKKARHILLHVHVTGSVELVIPWRASYRVSLSFLESKRQWIIDSLEKHRQSWALIPKKKLVSGEKIQCFGREYLLEISVNSTRKRSNIKEEQHTLHVQVHDEDRIKEALEKWYRKKALAWFSHFVNEYTKVIQKKVNRIRVVDTKTRWGSCAHYSKVLSLNWRLALAPPEVAEYVVVHEVAHLAVPNHSRNFWSLVKNLDPLYVKHKLWLREYGHTLVF